MLMPAEGRWLLVDTAGDGVQLEPLRAADFSRPLAKVVLTSAPATVIADSRERVENLAATLLAAEAAGVTRWALDTAVAYAKVREQFGKPIGSFQAVKHLCAEMLCRAEQAEVAAADAAGPLGKLGTPTTASSPSRPRWPPASVSPPPKPTSKAASRCSAASAAPGSTMRTCTCAGPTPTAVSSVVPSAGCAALPR
ncbi:acyl-CoA dehydrogenase, C-terminal domain protein [Mycobacterium kansasii]|uniref:Acyl-CoA dehydrogenase, C-terminal domain protein n=1 Tax=Mycobacterium kansasii TaxID=1768 RepID=A0A1V3X0Y1_MYCKA|nr:acyl-CoA dehydrogenase, C-terminal domain protein [Mycobacterium kansasii]